GDPLAEIDNESLSIQARVLKRQIEAKEEALRAYYRELEFTKVKAQSSVFQAQASVEIARNRLKEVEAEFNRRKAQMQRYKNLSEKGVAPKERFEEIQKVYLQAKEQLKAARAALQAEEARLQEARALGLKTKALQAKIKAMDKEILSLKAQLQRIKLDIKKTVIRAPSDGIIYRKLTEEGEVLGPMGPVFVLLKPRSLHVRTFIPERYLAKVKVGQKVNVFTDAYPERAFKGYVCYIADRAEFTPKEIDTSEERVKQVFETKVCFDTAPEELKKGMPVDVVFGTGE
ncbi:MAG: HlyD family efflux transporter periplasmic adaptor subunit, partial [Nitrospirae bacterium]